MRKTSSKAVLNTARVVSFLAILVAVCWSAWPQEKTQTSQPETSESKPAADLLLRDARRLYRAARFEEAAAKYRAALTHDDHSAEAYAGITRCYLKSGKVQEASEAVAKATQILLDSETLHVARGELFFRQGKMHDAEDEFLKVVNPAELKPGSADLLAEGGWADGARAYLGLARVSEAASMHEHARQMLEKAHALDLDDLEIEWLWLNSLPVPDRIKALSSYLANPRIEDTEREAKYKTYLERLKQQEKPPPHECTLVSASAAMETYLWPLYGNPPYLNGFGLDVKVNGKGSRLMVDTGVSGILLSPAKAARAGIIPRWQSKITGIGDKGQMDLYFGYADSIRVGPLEFRDCPVQVSAKDTAGHDGMVGPDFFSHYLVTLDFPGQMLKLSQLPKAPEEKAAADPAAPPPPDKRETGSPSAAEHSDNHDHEAEDSYRPPGMQSYTKVFRFDHMLLVPTYLNNFPPKLFLMDTGSNHTYISLAAAREVTKVRDDLDTRVIGWDGRVKKVYRADKANISFGNYKQENQDLVVFDHSALSQETGTEISGMLGFALLRVLKITIDYRDGLVDFSYDFTRIH